MTEDKFNLKWNDFECHIKSSFRDLRDEEDLFDVWLKCDDEEIPAHRLVLSSCSGVMKQMLRRRQSSRAGADHVVYMRGVSSVNMQHILDFMYHGEVSIAQDHLNSFLSVAEDLQVKGLTQNNQQSSNNSSRRSQPKTPANTSKPVKPSAVALDDDIEEITPAPLIKEEMYQTSSSSGRDHGQEVVGYQEDDNYGYEDMYEDNYNYQDTSAAAGNKGKYHLHQCLLSRHELHVLVYLEHDQLDAYIKELCFMTEHKTFACGVCQKEGKQRQDIERHIESIHVTTKPFQCDSCGTKHKTRKSHQEHLRAFHKI